MRTLVVFMSILTLATACKGKPKHHAPAANVLRPTANANGSNGPHPAPDIVLPVGTGAPPKKTTAPIDEATLTKMQAMAFPGFTLQAHGFNAKVGMEETRQKTEDHPRIWATITIKPCSVLECTPMDLDQWKAKGDALKELLTPELKAMPDTVFEVGTMKLNGTPMIYTYQLAETKPTTAVGSGGENPGHFAWSHAFILYFNDGANSIRVVSEFKDDPMDTKEAMAAAVPRGDLENVAKAFMDVYTQAW